MFNKMYLRRPIVNFNLVIFKLKEDLNKSVNLKFYIKFDMNINKQLTINLSSPIVKVEIR
jgi:hypothetical protein